jgi:DNA-binding GntR family transcriptional regulator
VSPVAWDTALRPLGRVSAIDYVLGALRSAIEDGRIPQGERLHEAAIAKSLGSGRGVVREAIRQLIQEGLAEHRLHRGAFVRTMEATDGFDVYAAREAIEVAAAERLLHLDPQPRYHALAVALERIRLEAMSSRAELSEEGIDADIAFHRELVSASESPRLARAYETLATETRMVLRHHPPYPPADQLGDHERLYAAVKRRDPALPELVRAHLRLSAALIEDAISRRSHE